MEVKDLAPVLEQHAFLAGLPKQHVDLLVGCASNRKFDKGEYLCRQGESAEVFYLLRDGIVAVELYLPQKGGVRLETLREGDVLGWSWLVAPYTWHFDARAVTPVRAIVLDGKCLRGKCQTDYELGYHLFARFATIMEQRLESARLQLLDLYGGAKEVRSRDAR
ncbi:MAG: cyclic nucleotide-binding domain-containing protein [Bryobacteraceae bacterium]|nr:cyclic nucleotide-binding domain-containing protein [Bryobacteraceae bacterium]MDW8379767.1 cyclic nucleotide-binding domain-containing protein [Bryobacterales bacterium]